MTGLPRFARNDVASIILIIILLTIGLDQLSKHWLLGMMGAQHSLPITDWFALVLVWNHGISFGMLNHGAPTPPWMLVVMAVVVSAMLLRLALKSHLRFERLGYALVIGGALGNAIDRLHYGAVADFLYFHIGALGWPAFNIADSAICIGVGLLLIMLLRTPPKP